MPNDPLAPRSAGDELPRDTRTWNAILDAARDHRQPGRPRGKDDPRKQWGTVEALALNDTGAALREYKPAAVTDYGGYDVTDDAAGAHWQRRPLVTLGVPAAATDLVAVTLEAIPDGAIGRVAIAGYVLCDVNDAGTPTHAGPSAAGATSYLTGGTSGPIRIIKWPSGSGSTRRAGVLLGGQIAATGGTGPSLTSFQVTASPNVISTSWATPSGFSTGLVVPTLAVGQTCLFTLTTWGTISGAGSNTSIQARLYDGTGTLTNSERILMTAAAGATENIGVTLTWVVNYLSSGKTLTVQFQMNGGVSWTTKELYSNSSGRTVYHLTGPYS